MRYLYALISILFVSTMLMACGGMDPEEVSRRLTHRYEGGGIAMQLKPVSGVQWAGSLSRNGVSMPVEATLDGSTISGHFLHEGARFAFVAQLYQEEMVLSTGGESITLQNKAVNPLINAGSNAINPLTSQQEQAPSGSLANPLAGGGSSSASPPASTPAAGSSPMSGTAAPVSNPLGGAQSAQAAGGSAAAGGTVIQADVPYRGPKRLDSPSTGVSFEIPSGWEGAVPGGLPLMMMGNAEGTHFSLVWAQAPVTMSEIQQLLRDPIDLGGGAMLQASGLQINAGRIAAQVTGRGGDGRQLTGAVQGMHQGESAVVFLVVGSPGSEARTSQILDSLVKSTAISRPASTELRQQVAQYQQMLGGTRLQLGSSETFDGGFVQSYRRWDFCSNGQYQYSEGGTVGASVDTVDYDTGGTPGNVSAMNDSGGTNSAGMWQLDAVGTLAGEALMVTLEDQRHGRMQEMIAPTDNGVYFRGETWSATGSELCN